jgi:hypothetical protein
VASLTTPSPPPPNPGFREQGLFIIGGKDDGRRGIHADADKLMHGNLIPCTACQFVKVDMMNDMIASPLNDWNEPTVCIGCPIKESLETNLAVVNGLHPK